MRFFRNIVESKGKRAVFKLVLTLLFVLIYFYFELPALNLQDPGLYSFVLISVAFYVILSLLTSGLGTKPDRTETIRYLKAHCLVPLILIAALIVAALVGWLTSVPFFRARAYAQLLDPVDSNFAADVSEISYDQIPMLDSNSAQMLGNRKLGELSDMVSQFEVSSAYAQINYQGRPVRVTYLHYGDFFKWINNQKNGLPAYLTVDMVTQEASVIRLENGMRYSPSELFFRNLDRHLRLQYPTYIFDDVNFEIDETGKPWWIASVLTKRIGLFGGVDVKGAVLCDAITGESTYYALEDVPTWVDRVATADLIIQQYNYHGLYQGGYWNSLFGQKNVTNTTEGYNYIAMDDDVWVYTGVTSVTGDESNVGFILVNQRTKEARYYAIPGAEEYSAMDSAAGVVQDLKYRATFPLLLNISGEPTYFMALKDSSELVKMYAMVNVRQYQIVATGQTVGECQTNYEKQLLTFNVVDDETEQLEKTVISGEITDLRSAVIEGNTVFFLRIGDEAVYYRISAAESEAAILLNVGDSVTVTYRDGSGDILQAVQLERN